MKTRAWWGFLGVTLAGITGAFLWQSLTPKPSPTELPALGEVRAFSLTDAANRTVTHNDLRGKTWIADFVYTHCPDQCPMMSRHIENLQALIPKEAAVEFVSVSVDPEHDTPAVLAIYARRFHADPERWRFLTGRPDAIRDLMASLKLAAPAQASGSAVIDHSNRLVLVDELGRIRGYYDGTDENDVQRLVKDVSAVSSKK